ncbi:MAG: hypothetical protein ABW188_13800 [Rhodococcus fascians]
MSALADRQGRMVRARPLPTSPPLISPVTRSKLVRAGAVYSIVWVFAVCVAAFGDGRSAVAAAGLLLPGGGHLASGNVVHAGLALAAFALALLLWWMIGAVVAPVIVWIGLLVEASFTHHHGHLSPVGVAVTAGFVPVAAVLTLSVHAVRHRRQCATAVALNDELSRVEFFESAVPSSPEPPVGEASIRDLEHFRFALDLALQPLPEFVGFDRRDQYREAALRYQLSILGYALSMFRYTRTPAFSGYLAEAQENSILKMGDRKVWGYWARENGWGRLSLGRDPVLNKDNVMLTGWQGVAVGMYESFGDARFSREGGLTYTWSDDEQYRHDFHTVAASIHRNMTRSPFTLYSCEPRWIYPVCNSFGVNTLILHDRLHRTDYFAELSESISRSYEDEFQRPDGKLIGVRNETLGLSWNIWASEGVSLPTTYWMNSFLPGHAQRAWWLTRRDSLKFDGDRYLLPRTAANRCDVGDYSFGSDSFANVFLSLTAREMGSEDIADSAFQYVDTEQTVERNEGVAHYSDLSTQGNLYSLMARFARPSVNRDLIGGGLPARWLSGPQLAEAAYPDVLVARAVTDGAALDLVLYPGASPRRVTLIVDRLEPFGSYRATGTLDAIVTADDNGRARIQVDLGGRAVVRLEPVL